mgnify:CR=1 FL=1
MIVSNGKSRCQVKRIDGVDFCLNVMTGDGNPMPLTSVYKLIKNPITKGLLANGWIHHLTTHQ